METTLHEILSPELVNMDAAFGQPLPMMVAGGSKASGCAMELNETDRLENTRIRLVFVRFFASLFKVPLSFSHTHTLSLCARAPFLFVFGMCNL